jgi:hypothetical protein
VTGSNRKLYSACKTLLSSNWAQLIQHNTERKYGDVPEDENMCYAYLGDQLNAEESESNVTLLQKSVACCSFNRVSREVFQLYCELWQIL